jgi:hypothetical protein
MNVGGQTSCVTLDPSADDPWYRKEGWTDAAFAGVALGLKLAGTPAHCRIARIHGMSCDTNATLMAIAAIRAVWSALEFEPGDELSARLDTAILRRSEISVAKLEGELREI